ncbi:unnamed protein product [Peniophora sp. CBMAI 1063]|nr:unnamed protein product [Peniophora sp. CBMAI 1063]
MPASSSSSTHVRTRTRLLCARRGRALWHYTNDEHLLKGFIDALESFEDICQRGVTTGAIVGPGSILLDDGPEMTGWMVDFDIPHHPDSPMCDYTSLHFMSGDDLCHIVNTGASSQRQFKTPEEVEAARAETLAYTLAYALFRTSIACKRTPGAFITPSAFNLSLKRQSSKSQSPLASEFAHTFENADIQLLLANREAAGPFAWATDAPELACGIRWLLDQLYDRHRSYTRSQANARACAFLTSMQEDEDESPNVASATVLAATPYTYESLHELLDDALSLVLKMSGLPSPNKQYRYPFPTHIEGSIARRVHGAVRRRECCIQ